MLLPYIVSTKFRSNKSQHCILLIAVCVICIHVLTLHTCKHMCTLLSLCRVHLLLHLTFPHLKKTLPLFQELFEAMIWTLFKALVWALVWALSFHHIHVCQLQLQGCNNILCQPRPLALIEYLLLVSSAHSLLPMQGHLAWTTCPTHQPWVGLKEYHILLWISIKMNMLAVENQQLLLIQILPAHYVVWSSRRGRYRSSDCMYMYRSANILSDILGPPLRSKCSAIDYICLFG